MLRTFVCAALAIMAAAPARPLLAETPSLPAPPPWRDHASVYLAMSQSAPTESAQSHGSPPGRQPALQVGGPPEPAVPPPVAEPSAAPPPFDDPSVQHALYTQQAHVPTTSAAQDADEQRRLAPPAPSQSARRENLAPAAARNLRALDLPWKSASTMAAALAIVVGSFLICAWLLRRGTRSAAAALPQEVVSVLGRVPIAARNVAQLLRVGNKLVLVSLTPDGAEPLTEVTDPTEVDRLVGLCQQSNPHSTTKAFERVFRQLSTETAPDGFLGQDAPFGPTVPDFEPRHAYRREGARG